MQEYKTLIDTGIKGNSSTGDILYDGGEKLNINMNNIYNTFGDYRLFDETMQGQGKQKLHGTGYYQKHTRTYYLDTPEGVEMGSLHDVDTSTGKLDIKLPAAKLGEGIVIINSNGSLSKDTPVILSTFGSDTIAGHGARLSLEMPKTKTTLWCTRQDQGIGVWEYRIESMFGNHQLAVDSDLMLDTTKKTIEIGNVDHYNTIKLLLHGVSQNQKSFKSSEMLISILHSSGEVYKTEYAVLKNNGDLFSIDFVIESGILKAKVKSLSGNVAFSIKSIGSIKVGAV